LIQKAVFWWLRKKLEITDEPVKVHNFLKPPLKIWICKLPVTSKRVITENIVRMIILLINNQNVKDKGYDLKGGMSIMIPKIKTDKTAQIS